MSVGSISTSCRRGKIFGSPVITAETRQASNEPFTPTLLSREHLVAQFPQRRRIANRQAVRLVERDRAEPLQVTEDLVHAHA